MTSRSEKLPLMKNPALYVWVLSLAIAAGLIGCGERGPIERKRPIIQFAHPLSQKLDAMMRADGDVLVVGDPDFVARMQAQEDALGGSVTYLELPQVDLYALVAVLPVMLGAKSRVTVLESIPAYWAGDVYMAQQPSAGAIQAAMEQVPFIEATEVEDPPPPGRDYIISPPTQPFNFAEAMRLVFDNYSGNWRELDDCLLWVTNEELLAEAPPEFVEAYREKFSDPSEMHVHVGHVGTVDYVPELLQACAADEGEAAPSDG